MNLNGEIALALGYSLQMHLQSLTIPFFDYSKSLHRLPRSITIYIHVCACVCESRGGKGVSGRVPKAVGGLVIIGFYWSLLDWPLADFKFTMHKPCSSLDWLPHQSVTSESPPWTPPPPPPQMPLFAQFHLRCSHCFSQTPNTSICFNDAIPDNCLSGVQRWNV